MCQYKNIKYFVTWIEGNWYLIISDYQRVIEIVDDYNDEIIREIIENRICKFIK